MSNKVLVTGAAGFTGGHLARRLASSGVSVRALVRDPRQCADLVKWGIEPVQGDLRDAQSLRQAVQGIDIVYHIAALFRPENVSRQDMWDTNVQGTRNILEASRQAGVKRFVHCSTVGVHGDVKHPPATEESPYRPGDYYQDSKTEGEKVALEYMAQQEMPVVVFRPGGIYGPGDLRFLKLFKSIKKQRFIMFGSGEIKYQLIYIDDLVDGIILCGEHQAAPGQIFILTGEHPVTLNQFARTAAKVMQVPPPRLHFPILPVYLAGFLCELVCKPIGIQPPLYRRRVDFFRKTRWFDISKARRVLGFQPKVDMEHGFQKTVAWYEQEGLL